VQLHLVLKRLKEVTRSSLWKRKGKKKKTSLAVAADNFKRKKRLSHLPVIRDKRGQKEERTSFSPLREGRRKGKNWRKNRNRPPWKNGPLSIIALGEEGGKEGTPTQIIYAWKKKGGML